MIKTVLDTLRLYFLRLWLKVGYYRLRIISPKRNSVFLLAPYLPPLVNGGVYRPLSWLKYSKDNGWYTRGFTKHTTSKISQAAEHLLKQIPKETVISQITPSKLSPSWRLTPKIDGNFLTAIQIAQRVLEEIRYNKPSVIVATGPSFDFFIAGYYVSKATNIPLVLDYRDEWTENPFPFVRIKEDDREWEQRIFRHAAKIIFTTPLMLKHQSEVFRRTKGLSVIYNGWEESEVLNESVSADYSDNKIRLLYAGVLADHADPSQFFDAIISLPSKLKDQIQISILGDIANSIKPTVNRYTDKLNIEILKPVRRDEAIKIMSRSDYLLLFATKDMTRYIPGKLFDYAASGKPILAYGFEGEISRCINEGKLGVFCPLGMQEKLESALDRKARIEFFKKQTQRNIWLKNKTRHSQAEKFFQLLNETQCDR